MTKNYEKAAQRIMDQQLENAKKKAGRKSRAEKEAEIKQAEERKNALEQLIDHRANQRVEEIMHEKIEKIKRETGRALAGRPRDSKVYRKWTTQELIALFGGWYTLTYAFSVKGGAVDPLTGKEIETDYYICSQDVSGMDVNSRPMVNKIIEKEFGKQVYGFALIAPAVAFG